MNSIYMVYNHPSDDLASTLTPTLIDGTLDSDYGVMANLTNGNIALPFKVTTTSLTLQWDLGSAKALQFLALFHTNLDASTCQWKFADAADFSGTVETQTIVLPTVDADGYYDNPVSLRPSPIARRYLRLVISGNSDPVTIGGLWFSEALRQPLHPHAKGLKRIEKRKSYQHETIGGVRLSYDIGCREQAFENISITTSRAAGLPLLQEWFRSARGAVRPFPVVMDPATQRCWFMTFTDNAFTVVGINRDWVQVTLNLREVGRGLAW